MVAIVRWKFIAFIETTRHKLWVFWYILRVCFVLFKRAIIHDMSKYSKYEAPYFEKSIPQLRNLEYGSDKYKAAIESLGPALNHHYQKNPHHPEYWRAGFYDMSSLDIIEMLCDWKAAGRRHSNGNFQKSLEVNRTRFGIRDTRMNQIERDSIEIGLLW